jgi:L-ascorbate metabolism protein UlaG (beta-lactamase superfamily)
MKITKFEHSCIMVEVPDRTAIFDPGVMSEGALDVSKREFLDDIFITHAHEDHLSIDLIKKLAEKFPDVRITATEQVVNQLQEEGIKASNLPPEGVEFFTAPHEPVEPAFPMVDEIGIHYLNKVTHPGDSHTFTESKEILLLPVAAPWGSMVKAINLAIELGPKHVVPIHDWHLRDEARIQLYGLMENLFNEHGIKFYKAETGQPFNIDI